MLHSRLSPLNDISDIKYAFYINLESRYDRKNHAEEQFKLINLNVNRFNAIKNNNGTIGCYLSHIRCLEMAKKNNLTHVLICEDDITFTKPEMFINQINTFLNNHKSFDVLLMAGNNLLPYDFVDNNTIRVKNCQTTTGYLVLNHYYNKLINNFRVGLNKLIREPENHRNYAIDIWWKKLQEEDNWYLCIPLSVIQKPDYSDIEKRNVN